MIITREVGNEELAKVFVAQFDKGSVECAESIQPPFTREEKWVLIVSCLLGCPVKCLMCDAGQQYSGCLSKEEILEQIDFLIRRRFPTGFVPVKKFKIQFTRMGEPAFNSAVLDVLEELPKRYDAPGLIPSISTIGPKRCSEFFKRLTEIKNRLYPHGKFQMQFSIHTTDLHKRNALIPVEKMSFEEIASFAGLFYREGDRKITLNFIVMEGYPLDPHVLADYFRPDLFMIKLTPLNPTRNAAKNRLVSGLPLFGGSSIEDTLNELKRLGFDVIVSIGEEEENKIGSNCGQYLSYKSLVQVTPPSLLL